MKTKGYVYINMDFRMRLRWSAPAQRPGRFEEILAKLRPGLNTPQHCRLQLLSFVSDTYNGFFFVHA